jgi:hypothetical protein
MEDSQGGGENVKVVVRVRPLNTKVRRLRCSLFQILKSQSEEEKNFTSKSLPSPLNRMPTYLIEATILERHKMVLIFKLKIFK